MINISKEVKSALLVIDERKLDEIIDQAVKRHNSETLRQFPLSSCGIYIVTKLHSFEDSLIELKEAKSAKKRDQKLYEAERSARDLSFAVSSMKRRMEEEEKEGQLFYVDDDIPWPYQFNKRLEVKVSYRWRRSVEEPWTLGKIMFHHDFEQRRDFTAPTPKRKPSVAQQAKDLQTARSQTWEQLKMLSLCSVRDFFRSKGDGSDIPSSFQAKTDSYSGGLNNYSADFWKNAS